MRSKLLGIIIQDVKDTFKFLGVIAVFLSGVFGPAFTVDRTNNGYWYGVYIFYAAVLYVLSLLSRYNK